MLTNLSKLRICKYLNHTKSRSPYFFNLCECLSYIHPPTSTQPHPPTRHPPSWPYPSASPSPSAPRPPNSHNLPRYSPYRQHTGLGTKRAENTRVAPCTPLTAEWDAALADCRTAVADAERADAEEGSEEARVLAAGETV
jgi:hypothetical protein